jgi:IMP dehydrogenase
MPGLREGLFFDDVMLLPRRSEILPSHVNLETGLSTNVTLRLPFMTSAWHATAGYRLSSTVARAGGIGILPLFGGAEDQAHEVRKVKELVCKEDGAACDLKGRPLVGALIDVERDGLLEWIGSLAEVWVDIVVVDVPHADRLNVLHQIQAVKAEYDWLPLMVGNIQTRAGAKDVFDAGADVVVVGGGFSSFVEATERSGVGMPELTALMEVQDVASLYGRPIVCNMDVHSPASVVKALAAGAAAVVLNGVTSETASAVITQIAGQVCESLSCVGAGSIAELREKAEFVRIHPPAHS